MNLELTPLDVNSLSSAARLENGSVIVEMAVLYALMSFGTFGWQSRRFAAAHAMAAFCFASMRLAADEKVYVPSAFGVAETSLNRKGSFLLLSRSVCAPPPAKWRRGTTTNTRSSRAQWRRTWRSSARSCAPSVISAAG